MKASNISLGVINPVSIGLAIVAALLVIGVLNGRKIPLISGDRAALGVLFIIGFVMCSFGIKKVADAGLWAHPLSIIGYILGALILIYTAAGFFNFRLPLVSSTRESFIVVAALIVGKFVLGMIHRLL